MILLPHVSFGVHATATRFEFGESLMAKIAIEFDTVTKKAKAAIDGETIEKFSSFELFRRYTSDEGEDGEQFFYCNLRSEEVNEEEGMTVVNVVYASEMEDIQRDMKNFFAKSMATKS